MTKKNRIFRRLQPFALLAVLLAAVTAEGWMNLLCRLFF